MKRNKLYLLLFALFALGQTAWAQEVYVSNELELRYFLSSNSTTATLTDGGLITLTGGELVVDRAVTINLGNRPISGGDNCRIFNVTTNGDLTLTGESYLTHGAADDGAIIYNAGTLTIEGGLTLNLGNAIIGGAIYNAGTLTLNGGNITRCNATNGGAIYNTGELTINAGVIGIENYPNTATNNGGAIYNAGGTININGGNIEYCTASTNGGGIHSAGGSITMTGGSISYNSATGNCGGVNLTYGSTMTMSDGNIDNNHSDANDGGMYIGNGSSLTMSGGSVTGNTANYYAGIRVAGTMTMSGGSIANNTANNNSGGVHINSGSTLTMTGGSITGNTAENYAGIRVIGTLTMTGGSVTSNTATTNYGGIRVEGTLNMSGSPIVMGNLANGNSNNLYLPTGKTITVNGAFAMGAIVGVTSPGGHGTTITSGYATYNPEPGSEFMSDDNTLSIGITGGEAKLLIYIAPDVPVGSIPYLNVDETGDHGLAYCETFTLMSSLTDNSPTLSNGWYVVDQNLTFNTRITISDTVNLILMDNTTLTANNSIFVPHLATLHIWAQSTKTADNDHQGMIRATANAEYYSGIGGRNEGDAGHLYFHGGIIGATGGNKGAGINGHPIIGEGIMAPLSMEAVLLLWAQTGVLA